MKIIHPRFLHLLMGWPPLIFTRAPRLSYVVVLLVLSGCCSHVDHKKLATFPTIRKSFEGLKSNLNALKLQDDKDEELRAASIEECEAGIDLCKQVEAR